MMKKMMMFLLSMSMTLGVFAAPTVSDVRVNKPHGFPWDNNVGIQFTVSGIGAGSHYILIGKAKNLDSGTEAALNSLNMQIPSNGVYHVVWNAKADLGSVAVKRMKIALKVIALEIIAGNHRGIQLWAGGPYWAATNIGAEKPEDAGYYFWWGDTKGYRREGGRWVASDGAVSGYSFWDCPTYNKNNATLHREGWITADGNLAPAHDAAQAHWGKTWRMPTDSEMSALISNTTTEWTRRNGVYGRLVKGKGAYSSASIFLPAAGYGNSGVLGDSGSYGLYWSSTPTSDPSYNAWFLGFFSGHSYRSGISRYYGQSVRPVSEFAE